MDSLTQIALGIATAHVVAGKQLGKRIYLYGAVFGTIPDLDILSGFFLDEASAAAFHRSITHSILFILVVSPFFGWLVSLFEKNKISWKKASSMVFWCLMTHVLLDLFTAWGTQIFWPNDTKVALKTIFVVDPLYTFPLLLALILAFKKPDFQVRNKIIWKEIVVSSIYLMLTCCLKIFALHKFETALQFNKIRYSELIVKPTAFNTILWNANVSTKEGFLLADYSLFDSKPISFKEYKKDVSAEKKLAGNKDFETLAKMSEGWYLVTQKNNNFYFNDLRFGLLDDDPNHPQFAFSYVFVEENGMLKAREVPKKSRQGAKLLKNLMARIKGN